MKLRFVLLGPEDDPGRDPATRKPAVGTRRYEKTEAGIVRVEHLGSGRTKITPVTNFSARIARDLILDDGEQQQRHVGLDVELGGRRVEFSVSAMEFTRMGWVSHKLGPEAIIYPGQQQHARAAIQSLSGEIPQEYIFSHLGWRRHGPDWVYFHAEGALCAAGTIAHFQVCVPRELRSYQVRSIKDPNALVRAVRSSFDCLSLAPDRISFPLLAAVYRAPFGAADFSVFLAGKTGVFKTALAALCQQHFGASMDAGGLPANFSSTANAVERLAFDAKDALLVVDDFAPSGGHSDSELHHLSERLFRAAGNRQGRSRLGGNGRLNSGKPPRALVLATGEEVPPGQSIRARLLVVEVRPGDVNRAMLTDCQRAGQQGRLAESLGSFLAWMASRYEEVQQRRQGRMLEIRNHTAGRAIHARLPAALAELQSAWELFLEFAVEIGAISKAEAETSEARSSRALRQLAALQASYHNAGNPALRFVGLLKAALTCGDAHVADRRGRAPHDAELWGWRRTPTGWTPQGDRIGWLSEDDLYLEPRASYRVAQGLAGSHRLVSEQALRRRLGECSLLASVDAGRQMVQVRRTLEGVPRQVLHLKVSDLVERRTEAPRIFSIRSFQ